MEHLVFKQGQLEDIEVRFLCQLRRKVGRAYSIASFHSWNDVKTNELFCASGYLVGKGDSGLIPFSRQSAVK
jgi:hypothetical protein